MAVVTFPRVTGVINIGIGEKYVRTLRFALISSGTSGTVTLPTNAEVVLDSFGGLTDALIYAVTSGYPNGSQAFTAGGAVVATTFNSSGAYVLSGTPSSYPVAIVYQVRQLLEDFDSTSPDILGFLTLDNRDNIRTYFSATAPVSYNPSTGVISSPITGGPLAGGVLYTDASANLNQNANFNWANVAGTETLQFSKYGTLYGIANEVFFKNTIARNWVQLLSDSDILLHSNSVGEIRLSELIADLAQIVGPTIKDGSSYVVIDFSSTLKFLYQSGQIAWDVEGAQINYTNGFPWMSLLAGTEYMSDSNGVAFCDIIQRLWGDELGGNSFQCLSGGIVLWNKISTYNQVPTAGIGMPFIKYEYKTTGSTGNLNNNYVVSAATAGQYRISLTCVVTGAWGGATTMSATLAWNNGTAKTKVLFPALSMTAVGNEEQYVGTFDVAAGTTINISTALAAITGSGNYRFKTEVEKIGD